MSRVYRSATVRKFCARYGLTIKWQHERQFYRVTYEGRPYGVAFTKETNDDKYWRLNTHGIPIRGMRGQLKGMYTFLRGLRTMFDRIIGYTIDAQGRETFFVGWTGQEFLKLGRPEDLGMFTQGFDGDMPVGVFRDWLIDGGYLDA